MKRYLVDTNVFIRMLLRDIPAQHDAAVSLFTRAKEGKVSIFVLPEIFIEIDYVLTKVYALSKIKVIGTLEHIIATPYITIQERGLVTEMLTLYKQFSIKLVDAYLFVAAKKEGAEVFSFDRDFQKLATN